MLQPILIFTHVFLALGIVIMVLLQQGKGADAGAAFGAGSSGTVFGAKGSSSFLSRVTGILATLFFGTSITLAYFMGQPAATQGVMEQLSDTAPDVPVLSLPAGEDSGLGTSLPELTIPDTQSAPDTSGEVPAIVDPAGDVPDTATPPDGDQG